MLYYSFPIRHTLGREPVFDIRLDTTLLGPKPKL